MHRYYNEPPCPETGSPISPPTVAVVVLAPHETREQAWRRHLQDNPQDRLAEVKIFHLAHPGMA